MKKILVIAFVFIAQLNYSQTTIKLGDFDEIKIFDKLTVTLIKSDENKAVVTGNNNENVEVVNKNGKLKIRMKITKLMSGDGTKVSLYYSNIQLIDANEGSSVTSNDTFKQTAITLGAQEGAKINLKLDVDKCTTKVYSGGIVDVTGRADNQMITINSGGILKAQQLLTSQTSISVSAGGNAEINASTLVDAKVNAGGYIYIYGKPKQVNQQTFAGGKIIQK